MGFEQLTQQICVHVMLVRPRPPCCIRVQVLVLTLSPQPILSMVMVRLRRALKLLAIVFVVSCIFVQFIHRKDALYAPVSLSISVEYVDAGDGTVTSGTFPTSVYDQSSLHGPTGESAKQLLSAGRAPAVRVPPNTEHAVLSTEDKHYKSLDSQFNAGLRTINSVTQRFKLHYRKDNATNETTGFMISVDFWDQQTFSVKNILGLQGVAAWLGVKTVEPFLVRTKFEIPFEDYEAFHSNGSVSHMRMSDVYDIDNWNSESGKLHFKVSRLTPWEDFLQTASREVIFVKLVNFGNCVLGEEVETYNKTLTKIGFRLVAARCTNFNTGKPLTLSGFKSQLYGDESPKRVTMVFNTWSQMIMPHLTPLSSSQFISGNFILPLKPSRILLRDADYYRRKYLPPNGTYIGILLRAEWLIMNRGMIENRRSTLEECLNRASGWFAALKNQTQLSSVFVGMDVGKYGSTTLRDLTKDYTLNLSERFLQTAYNTPEVTLKKWEQTFTDVSSSLVPGYVAFLQKTVAVHGQCLLLIGFGSFQSHALQAYIRQRTPEELCYLKTDSQCRVKLVVGFKP